MQYGSLMPMFSNCQQIGPNNSQLYLWSLQVTSPEAMTISPPLTVFYFGVYVTIEKWNKSQGQPVYLTSLLRILSSGAIQIKQFYLLS